MLPNGFLLSHQRTRFFPERVNGGAQFLEFLHPSAVLLVGGEQVFFGFDPEKVVLMGAEHLERLMQDTRIIRHLGKLKSVPRNAQMILDVEQEKGSFAALIADWPVTDIVGLWKYLSKHGHQLGGLSAPRFLRMVGKDTFVPSYDVVAALNAQEIVDKAPTSLRDLATVQAAFNQWHAESGRPMCQLSMMLAFTVNH